jgi:hypothetical protein
MRVESSIRMSRRAAFFALTSMIAVASDEQLRVPPLPAAITRSVVIMALSSSVLSDNATLSQLPELAAIGVQSIAVDIMLAQDNATASTVYTGRDTPSDEDIRSFILAAQAYGLAATLKLIVVPVDGSLWMYDAPADPSAWFESYGNLLVRYARLAESISVSRFCIGTELAHMTVNPMYAEFWPPLIARIRAAAPALALTYAALFTIEYPKVPFWRLLDGIGIDAYFPLANASVPHPPVADMTRTLSADIDNVRAWRASAGLTNLPIYFTEVGYPSTRDGAVIPSTPPTACVNGSSPDGSVQSDAFTALFAVTSANADMVSWHRDEFVLVVCLCLCVCVCVCVCVYVCVRV